MTDRHVGAYLTETNDELPGFVTPDGQVRLLAYRPSDLAMAGLYAAPRLATAIEIIDRSEWLPIDRRREMVPIRDQGSVGSCNGNGATTVLMLARDAAGMSFELLSPCFVYAQINMGRDQGSCPSDAMDLLQASGTCLESEVPEGVWRVDDIPRSAYDTAKRFRVAPGQFYSFGTFDELVTATLLGWHWWLTVRVAGDWNRLDSGGCPPAYQGMGNHVMSGGEGLVRHPSGEWLVPTRQSWGTGWGMDGYCNLREAHFAHQPYFQGYAIQGVLPDPMDPNALPTGVGWSDG